MKQKTGRRYGLTTLVGLAVTIGSHFLKLGSTVGFVSFLLGVLLAVIGWLLALRHWRLYGSVRAWAFSRWASRITYGVLAAIALSVAVVEVLIISHAGGTGDPDADILIVLGAGLREDRPSAVLASRLEGALAYLQAHPEAKAVVSGGQGADEQYTEGSVMAAWLEERGIDPARIYREEKAGDTRENLRLSWEIIRQEGLSGRVAVVSNGYHLFRAEVLAGREGLGQVQTVSAPLPYPYLAPVCYLREYCSVMLMVFRGLF